jgi:hypothetical protein
MVILRVGLLVGVVNAKPLSHVGDDATEMTVLSSPASNVEAESSLVMTHCRCRAMPVMALSSPVDDDNAELTLVVARCRYRGDLAVAQCRCRVMLAMALPGRLGRDAM